MTHLRQDTGESHTHNLPLDRGAYHDASPHVAHEGNPVALDTGMQHTPGLYFGMPEEEYHAIPALSASGIKNLMVSAMDFWAWSWMNPDKPNGDTDAKIIGTAYHKRILEGREAFYNDYAAVFDASEYPDALKTMDDLKQVLKDLDLKIGGNKPALIERIQEADPNIQILDALKAEYTDNHPDKVFLNADLIKRIEIAAAMIENHPQLSKCFSGGHPEVTVIWHDTETGVPMKSRIDYLKAGAIIDLKTFSNNGKPIDRAIYHAMASYKYHVQSAVYTEADRQAVNFAKEGSVFGDVDPEWIKKYASVAERPFVFVFQQTGIAPVARGKIMPQNLVYDCGVIAMREAMNKFADNLKHYGADPWIDTASIEEFSDDEFPIWTTE